MSYRDIADDLETRIKAGEYPPGTKLPTHKELRTLYAVSESTAARAVILLHERHLVTTRPGLGLFVVDGELPPPRRTRKA